MIYHRGFTLIETLISTVILVTGLLAVASMFSAAIQTNLINRERATAMFLLQEKVEDFKFTPADDPLWSADGSDFVNLGGAGSFTRIWKVVPEAPRKVTVMVYTRRRQLARATTMVSE